MFVSARLAAVVEAVIGARLATWASPIPAETNSEPLGEHDPSRSAHAIIRSSARNFIFGTSECLLYQVSFDPDRAAQETVSDSLASVRLEDFRRVSPA